MHSEDERKAQAIRRLEAKLAFRIHLVAYAAVSLLLMLIWVATSDSGYFWPVWPMIGGGIGLAVHGWITYSWRPISNAKIEHEMNRDQRRRR